MASLITLVAVLPSAYGQSFISAQPQPKPATDAQVVTPAFVADPGRGKTGVVPAHAVARPGATSSFQVIPVAAQQPGDLGGLDEDKGMLIRTDLPGDKRLFIRESEEQFWNRYRNELGKEGRMLFIPEPTVVSTETFRPRAFQPITKQVEPAYVCHRRLLFEQPNFERTGWDLGIFSPAVNLGVFYYDFAMLPYHFWSDPHDRGECSAGKCLPGDPAPLLLYRERYSTMGMIGQAATITGLVFLFP